tara:strand:+ start:1613 stop:1951 length:339 start_codon:yes stop_codon:yes gene_type:complete
MGLLSLVIFIGCTPFVGHGSLGARNHTIKLCGILQIGKPGNTRGAEKFYHGFEVVKLVTTGYPYGHVSTIFRSLCRQRAQVTAAIFAKCHTPDRATISDFLKQFRLTLGKPE